MLVNQPSNNNVTARPVVEVLDPTAPVLYVHVGNQNRQKRLVLCIRHHKKPSDFFPLLKFYHG